MSGLILDQAMIALLAHLQAKGLLDQTLVVVCTEFNRRLRINDNDGRDHHDETVGCLLAGVGIGGGDTRTDNFEGTQRQSAVLDQAMKALLANVQTKGLTGQQSWTRRRAPCPPTSKPRASWTRR